MDTGRNERIRDEMTGKERRLERNERWCRQCGSGLEDEIHAICTARCTLRCVGTARKHTKNMGLKTLSMGVSDVSTAMEDKKEAEKTMVLDEQGLDYADDGTG